MSRVMSIRRNGSVVATFKFEDFLYVITTNENNNPLQLHIHFKSKENPLVVDGLNEKEIGIFFERILILDELIRENREKQ